MNTSDAREQRANEEIDEQLKYERQKGMDNKEFIERVYELAFGHDAINRNFGHAEVIEQLEEFNEDSLKWDSIPDDEKEEYENAFYSSPDKEDLAE